MPKRHGVDWSQPKFLDTEQRRGDRPSYYVPDEWTDRHHFNPDEYNPPGDSPARPQVKWQQTKPPQPTLPDMPTHFSNDPNLHPAIAQDLVNRGSTFNSLYPADRKPQKVYRNIELNMAHPDLQPLHRALFGTEGNLWDAFSDQSALFDQVPIQADSRGFDNPELGHHILNHLQNNPDRLGMGIHWSTDPDVASNMASSMGRTNTLSALISGEWMGRGEDPYRTDTGGHYFNEDEITMMPGAPIRVTNVHLRHPYTGNWHSVFDGEPQNRTAAPKKGPELLLRNTPQLWTPQIINSPMLDKHGFSQDRLNHNALTHWDAANPQDQEDAEFWYPVAHNWADHMTDHMGIHPHKGYGLVAAGSPERRWDGNLQDTHNFMTHYPTAPENVRKFPGKTGKENLARMMRVYHAPDDPAAIRNALSKSGDYKGAPKLFNFHDNMLDPYDPNPSTIDSWMPRGILWAHDEEPWWPEELNKPINKPFYNKDAQQWERRPGFPTARDIGRKLLGWTGGYDRMAEAMRHVARERDLGIANVAQAGIWSKLGGTPSPDGDSIASHPGGPLTHINDPDALYRYAWNDYAQNRPGGLHLPPDARIRLSYNDHQGFVDHHWDDIAGMFRDY